MIEYLNTSNDLATDKLQDNDFPLYLTGGYVLSDIHCTDVWYSL